MLYLGIDQHSKQLTVDLGNEAGDVVQHQQVKTDFSSLRAFFAKLKQRSEAEGGFMACLEICGFNDYLLKELQEHGCREIGGHKRDKRGGHKRTGLILGFWAGFTRPSAAADRLGKRELQGNR